VRVERVAPIDDVSADRHGRQLRRLPPSQLRPHGRQQHQIRVMCGLALTREILVARNEFAADFAYSDVASEMNRRDRPGPVRAMAFVLVESSQCGLIRPFLRVTSVHCVQRSSIRSPLPLRAPADRAQALPARIGLLALLGVPVLPAGRRAGRPGRRPADRLVPRPLTVASKRASVRPGQFCSSRSRRGVGIPDRLAGIPATRRSTGRHPAV
jgi:hypothetical protein